MITDGGRTLFTTDACALPFDLILGGTCVFGMAGAVAVSAILLIVTVGLLPFSPYRLQDLLHWPGNRGHRGGRGVAVDADMLIPGSISASERDPVLIDRILRVLIAVAAADGRLDDAEVEIIRAVFTGFFDHDISDHQVRRLYRTLGNTIDVEQEINRDLVSWHQGDETLHQALLQGMVVVAAADGELDPREENVIAAVGYALGLKHAETEALIREAEEMATGYTDGVLRVEG